METPPIRVVIADDHPITRDGLRTTLAAADGIEVVGEAKDGAEAFHLARTLLPNVLLLDVEMPKLTGVEVAERLRKMKVPVHILALSAYDDETYVYALLDGGAAGYLMKEEADAQEIVQALRTITSGDDELYVSTSLAHKLIRRKLQRPDTPLADLSEREKEVLRLVALGYDNGRIGETLFISKHTVKNHIDKIKNLKIGVRTRTELAAWAWQQGLVKPGDDA